jgi:hypothetical protein
MPLRLFGLSFSFLALVSCSGVNVEDYEKERPLFKFEEYFSGTIDGWGLVQDRSGKAINRFHVVIKASWAGKKGTLDEDFVFSDGKKEKRIWTVVLGEDGQLTATAADVVGEAKGKMRGNALQLRYVLQVPVGGTTYNMSMDDWMWQHDNEILFNRTKMKKFGITFAEISIFFKKRKP